MFGLTPPSLFVARPAHEKERRGGLVGSRGLKGALQLLMNRYG